MDKDIKDFVESYLQLDKGFQEEIRERIELSNATLSALIVYNNNSYSTQRQKDVLLSSYRKNIKRIETLTRCEYPNICNGDLDEYIKDFLNN